MANKKLNLDIEEIRLLTNYAHWIPAIHGYTNQFMKDTFPGWVWNDLIPNMLRNGLITFTPSEGDLKLLQGLWLKSGIDHITATKCNKKVSFEVAGN